jgi:hypothetical protein
MKNVFRYALYFLMLMLVSASQFACKKSKGSDDPGSTGAGKEQPGHIPGMGDTPGTPQGEPFKLPAGITLKGEIVGNDDFMSGQDCVVDGQGYAVTVKMKLHRDSAGTGPIEVVFPAGLVIVSASEGFQSGLLVERVVVTIPPVPPGSGGSDCQVTLMLFCLNANLKASKPSAKYRLGVVTNSEQIKNFIQKVSGKKISYSAYPAGNKEDYFTNSGFLQVALWDITDGEGLTKENLGNIQGVPNK